MSSYHFDDFELHEDLCQLKLHGKEVNLQPRAFDVLTYLVKNRSRVVDKDELLETLWPGVIVTDSSLQKAVSLARTALKLGGLDDAIRTYPRRGYRFMPDLDLSPAMDHSLPDNADSELEEARRLFNSGAWRQAAGAFERADQVSALFPRDLEIWGTALQCTAAAPEAVEPFERAAEAYSTTGECEDAARAMNTLGRLHFETGEWAVAKGCLQRAETMLEALPLCEQHGHLAWIRSWLASYENDIPNTLEYALQTVDIGRRLDNVDVEAMGLLFWGIALQASGDSKRGLALQDEAGAAVLTGRVTPLLGGLVYCGLLGGCCNTGDWPRASQWSESFTRWCRRNGVRRFSGSCLLHRVEVFLARGELVRAETELHDNDETIRMSGASVIAEARRFLAELHFLRAEFDQAETDFRAAYELGGDPHPGYALLLHRRGQSQAAIRALRRVAADGTNWFDLERKPLYLAFAAIIAAQSRDIETAQQIVKELDQQPDAWALGTQHANVLRARGEIDLVQDNYEEAVHAFRHALQIYNDMDVPLETAATRLRLAEAMLAVGDPEAAALELESAESVFARNETRLYMNDCRTLRKEMTK